MRRLFVLLLVGLCVPTAAHAFVRSRTSDGEQCLQWERRTIPWAMNERGHSTLGYDRVHEAFARAFATWEQVECTDITFVDRSPSSSTRIGYRQGESADNLIVFREVDCRDRAPAGDRCWREGSCGNDYDCWMHGSSVIAVTTTTYFENSGVIVDADIEMNAAWFDFTDIDGPPCPEGQTAGCVATDVQNTATHEIGHMLGLDHTRDRNATMFASAPRGETSKRHLGEDDVAGICHIYPAGSPTNFCAPLDPLTEEPAGCSCASGGGSAGSLAWLLLGLALWGRTRRRAP